MAGVMIVPTSFSPTALPIGSFFRRSSSSWVRLGLNASQKRQRSLLSSTSSNHRRGGPFRIVSLCPSTTLTLYDLGLAECVVGRTKYCEAHPIVSIPTFGGTKNPNWEQIASIEHEPPTHILFNMEENDHTHLLQAEAICTTLTDTPVSIEDSKAMVLNFGNLFDVKDQAHQIASQIDGALESLSSKNSNRSFSYWYFIWHTPTQRVVGQGTYIHDMLKAAGGTNNLAASTMSDTERYPLFPSKSNNIEVADYCLLSTEPYPFQTKHIPLYKDYGRQTKIIDGEMLSWHGSRTVQGLHYLRNFFQ